MSLQNIWISAFSFWRSHNTEVYLTACPVNVTSVFSIKFWNFVCYLGQIVFVCRWRSDHNFINNQCRNPVTVFLKGLTSLLKPLCIYLFISLFIILTWCHDAIKEGKTKVNRLFSLRWCFRSYVNTCRQHIKCHILT